MINLKDLGEFGKIFEKLKITGKLAVVFAVLFIVFSFGECNNHEKLVEFQIKYEQLQTEANNTKKFADSVNTRVAVLTAEAKNKDTVITRLAISIQTQKLQRQKLEGSLEVLKENLKQTKDTAQIVEIQKGIIYNLNEQVKTADEIAVKQTEIITNQKYQIEKLNTALELSTLRGDRLQETVNKFTTLKMPAPKKPFIGKKTAGIIGFIGGVFVGNKILQ